MGERKDEKKRAKAEWKLRKMRHAASAKAAKADAKIAKERAEAGLPPEAPTEGVHARFADVVRGGLYLLLGASMLLALVLGQRRAIVSLDELIESLFLATAGKLVLGVIAVALAIYGLRKLRVLR